MAEPSAPRPAVGARIADRYVLAGELGAGGMGVVHRARDERLGRDVAVKLLPAAAVGDAQARRRLMREARAAAGLEHPGIVRVYDVGETEDGGAYLVMELVPGASLREHLVRGTLPPRARLAALIEVGRALASAHERGFVHRDVKPDNVMIREDGRAVVLDFGLAKSREGELGVESATVTAEGSFVGTPAYMAPEQARGEPVEAATDQFALAVTVFEAVADRLPWQAKAPLEIVSEVLKGTPRRLRDVKSDAPAALEQVVERALSKRPADRFPTTAAFVDALEAAAAGVADGGLASAATVLAPLPAERPATTSAAVRPGSVPAARRASPALLLAALVVLVAGSGAWYVLRRPPATAPAPAASATAPLAAPTSVLACPALVASAYDFQRAEWLGAAAAHLACERAQIPLGGAARTLVPAELLGLPRSPGSDFPAAALDAADARDAMIRAAARADAWLDGRVERLPDGFHVVLALRAAGGAEAGRGEGRSATLLGAVRGAMEPLLASGVLPRITEHPWLRVWMGGASVDAALALHDLHVAVLDENVDLVRDECGRIRARADLAGMKGFADALCADRLGEPLPPRPVPDTGSGSALVTSASTLRLYGARTDADRAELAGLARALEDGLDAEPSFDARALRASAAAEVRYVLGDTDAALRDALAAIQASPKQVDVRGTAWHRASFTSKDDRLGILAPHIAWLPWEPFAHNNAARVLGTTGAYREGAHRAAALATHGYWIVSYGERLIAIGDVVAAGSVAAEAHSPSLAVRVMRADGRLGAALKTVSAELARLPARPDTSLEAAKLAALGVELAAVLEQPADHMGDFVDRFITPSPPVYSRGAVPLFDGISACIQTPAPVGPRCIARLAELFRGGHFGAGYVGAAEALSGAERYVAGDLAGAVRAWRAFTGRSAVGADELRDMLAVAFDRAGDPALADRIDAPALEAPEASLALVRAALRAEKRGDCAAARRLASRIVDRWDLADERPPAVDRMKKLSARCAAR